MNEVMDTYFRGARELLSSDDCMKLGVALIRASCDDRDCDNCDDTCPMWNVCKTGMKPNMWEV